MLLKERPSTRKQEDYAMAIHMELGVELPKRRTLKCYSMWIDRYAPTYKQVMAERQLDHEAHMEEIDARRDW